MISMNQRNGKHTKYNSLNKTEFRESGAQKLTRRSMHLAGLKRMSSISGGHLAPER